MKIVFILNSFFIPIYYIPFLIKVLPLVGINPDENLSKLIFLIRSKKVVHDYLMLNKQNKHCQKHSLKLTQLKFRIYFVIFGLNIASFCPSQTRGN